MFRDPLDYRRQNSRATRGLAVIGDKPRQIATGSQQIQSSLLSVSDFHCRFECATGLIMTILPQKHVPGEPFQLG